MSDTDSTAGEPTEPVELPTKQTETPEQQKEFELGVEYGTELVSLEKRREDYERGIHELERELGDPTGFAERMRNREVLRKELDTVQHRINLIKKWFATKPPTNLDGIPTDTDTLPADAPTPTPDTALSTELTRSVAIAPRAPRKPRKRRNQEGREDALARELKEAHNHLLHKNKREPTYAEIKAFLRRNRYGEGIIVEVNDEGIYWYGDDEKEHFTKAKSIVNRLTFIKNQT